MATRLNAVPDYRKRSSEQAPSRHFDPNQLIEKALDLAIEEDLGTGVGVQGIDVTTQAIVGPNTDAVGKLYGKQPGILAGIDIFLRVFKRFDKNVQIHTSIADGCKIDYEATPVLLATVEGKAAPMLSAERLALNLIQHMSGIATLTAQFVALAQPYGIGILDTRKTTPGIRVFEKMAVKSAGGCNHRFGLFDSVLIKDNHIQIAGGIKNAVAKVREYSPNLTIEVETTNLKEVEEALMCEVQTIMLDNMTPNMVKEAVSLIRKKSLIEVSGGINLKTIRDYLIDGVDFISVGALTHSASNVDMSLEIDIL